MGQLSLRRYEIGRVLGRGGTGTVYEAFDTRTHATVALKTVESSIAENVYRLKHEFRVLHDVQHQNLVHFGELACEDGTWYFTMELITGSTFIDYVRPRDAVGAPPPPRTADDDSVTRVVRILANPTSPSDADPASVVTRHGPVLDEARLRGTLAQLVEALSVLHEAGHVHRDVKPGNVLVSHEGRAVLLDFGLVFALAGDTPTDRIGTLAYMAPEQIVEGMKLGPATDWYAVGIMLFLALTGRLPFGADQQALEAKLSRPAPAPHELVDGLPGDLDRLCIDLLERSPRRRPTEDQLRARLGMPPRGSRPRAPGVEASPPFVGRADELARLTAALDDVRRGQARAVIVEGEPGVGKSALVQQFLATVGPGPVVLAGRCYEQESVPFNGVDSLIDALSEFLLTCSADEVAALRAGGVRYLATVFPVLARVPAIQAAQASGRGVVDQHGLREQAFGEAARLVRALTRSGPLIVVLDDLQWADADSLALLARSVLPASGAACLFVATRRSTSEASAPVAELRAAAEVLEVGGLPDDEARALWSAIRPTAGDAGADADGERASALREAAGHPQFLVELARAAQAGHLERPGAALLLDVLRERIQRHHPIEQRFLEVAAVAVAPTPYEVVARAADLDVGECLTRLRTLKAAQLVRVTLEGEARCVQPYHDRIRDAILEDLGRDADRVTALHRRLGDALLEGTPPAALRTRVFAIVHHLYAARRLLEDDDQRARVAELGLLASREARLATAYHPPRDYARTALGLRGATRWSTRYALCRDLHLAQMEAAFLDGDRDEARAVFAAARPRLAAIEDTAALWEAWIELETGAGRFADAIEAGRAGLAALGEALPAQIDDELLARQAAAVDAAVQGRTVAELEALPALDDPARAGALQLLMAVGPVAFFLDARLSTWTHLRMVEQALTHGLCAAASFGFAGHAMTLAALGKAEEAVAFGELALRVNERFGSPRLAPRLYVKLGAFVVHWVRPFADARARLRAAYELGVEHGDAAYEVYAATMLSIMTYCESTELATIRATGAWAHEVGARGNDRDMAAVPAVHGWYAATLAGELEAGRGPLDPATLDAATMPVAMFHYRVCSAELTYLAGDWRRAGELLAEAERRPGGSAANPITVEVCFLGALVAARAWDHAAPAERGELEAAVAARSARLDRWAASGSANYRVHALIVAAELARIRGRDDEAALGHRAAITAARAHGAAKREAIALELAARHLQDRDPARADELRRQAADAYRRWGAVAKADELHRGPAAG